jgi:hypothetical protein
LVFAFLHYFNGYAQTYEQEFQERASILINRVADFGDPGFGNNIDPEKFQWPYILARMKKYGAADDTANSRIHRYRNRRPFHFTLVGMARIMNQFALAPRMVEHKQLYLQNIFNRNDSYNAWTDEGTENHINMSRTSGYLAAQNALNNPAFPDAATRLSTSKTWIMDFAKRLYTGGTSEWNSSQYASYNIIGWLNLYDFADDPEVRAAARAVLDYYACELSVHYTQGWLGGAEMRAVGVPILNNSGNNLTNVFTANGGDYFAWFWFGDLAKEIGTNYWSGREFYQAIHAALSTYRPPSIAVKIAKGELSVPANYKIAWASYYMLSPAYLHAQMYRDKGYTLGSAYLPYGGWGGGSFAIVSWKLVGKVDKVPSDSVKYPQFVTGSGRYYNQARGRGRQPYDQFVQHKNVIIQMTKTPVNAAAVDQQVASLFQTWDQQWRADFIQRFSSTDDKLSMPPVVKIGGAQPNINESYISYPVNAEIERVANVFFIKLEKCYIAAFSLASNQPGDPVNDGNISRRMVVDQASAGSICGFVLEAANAADFVSFEAFKQAIQAKNGLDKSQLALDKVKYISLNNDTIEAVYQMQGNYMEPIFDWGFGPTTRQVIQTSPPYLQPTNYPPGGRVAAWSVNGNPFTLDSTWALYEGPNVNLKNEVLRFTEDTGGITRYYQVDYTGNVPVFSEGEITNAKLMVDAKFGVKSFPNPTHGQFFLDVMVPEPINAVLSISGIDGKLHKKLSVELKNSGSNVLPIDINKLPSGIYMVQLKAGQYAAITKIVLQ